MRMAALAGYAMRNMSPALIAASAVGFGVLTAQDQASTLPAICVADVSRSSSAAFALWPGLQDVTAQPSAMALAGSWLAMILAMMPLLLHRPLAHLRHRSLVRRRWRAIGLFLLAYGAIWLLAGGVLIPAAILLGGLPGPQAFMAALLMAALWQVTPVRQTCLNRCHRQPRLAASGIAADADVLFYGMAHGVWCVGACWPLMLLTPTAGNWHLAAMAAVTLVILFERYRAPRPPRWLLPALPRVCTGLRLQPPERHTP